MEKHIFKPQEVIAQEFATISNSIKEKTKVIRESITNKNIVKTLPWLDGTIYVPRAEWQIKMDKDYPGWSFVILSSNWKSQNINLKDFILNFAKSPKQTSTEFIISKLIEYGLIRNVQEYWELNPKDKLSLLNYILPNQLFEIWLGVEINVILSVPIEGIKREFGGNGFGKIDLAVYNKLNISSALHNAGSSAVTYAIKHASGYAGIFFDLRQQRKFREEDLEETILSKEKIDKFINIFKYHPNFDSLLEYLKSLKYDREFSEFTKELHSSNKKATIEEIEEIQSKYNEKIIYQFQYLNFKEKEKPNEL